MFAHRLLLLAEDFPPSVGGVQTSVSGLWQALPPEQSFVVAGPQPDDVAWDTKQAYRVTRAATRAWTYPRWRPVWQSARDIVRCEKIEAVVCAKALFEGRAAQRLQREFGTPYIVLTYAMEILTWLRQERTRRQLLSVLSGAARIVVVNEFIRQRLKDLGIPDTRIVKLYPGVAETYFELSDSADAFRTQKRLDDVRIVISVARLVPRKGHDVLLRAFAQIMRATPNACLLIVGDGPERERLQTLAADLGIGAAVTFLGQLPETEMRAALAAADVFALTPVTRGDDVEGFGIVYSEAAAMGLPAVASHVGGVPEAVIDGESGLLVSEGDVSATAGALRRLLTDETLRTCMGAQARARADKEFHWKGRALVFQGMVHALLSEQGTVDPRTTLGTGRSSEQVVVSVH